MYNLLHSDKLSSKNDLISYISKVITMNWSEAHLLNSKQKLLSVKIPEHCYEYMRLVAASLGHKRASTGNIRSLLIALGNAEYRLTPGSVHFKGFETIERLYDFISSNTAFTVSVRTDDGAIDRTVLCGKIMIDITGKFFLIAYAREVNTLEIDELFNNFAIDIERIEAVRTSELPWSAFVPSISVKFRLSPQSTYDYFPSTDDLSAVSSESGTLITRKVDSSELLIRELISYREGCFLLSPDSLQRKIVDGLQHMQNLYGYH